MFQIVNEPINPFQSPQRLRRRRSGSVPLHSAVVKADGGTGRTSSAAEYHPESWAHAELEQIAAVLPQRRLDVGKIISLVAICAKASMDSFAACHAGWELLKKMRTICKQEVFA